MSKWSRLGKVKEAHGLKGDLYVLLFAKEAPWIESLQKFALAAGDEGPFEILDVEKFRPHKDGLALKAKQLVDRTAAEKRQGLYFYMPSELLNSKAGEEIYLREILGFEVRTEAGPLGPILDFTSNGPQDILVVQKGDVKVEIPFVEAFLKKIDFEKRQVWMELPEGLWE